MATRALLASRTLRRRPSDFSSSVAGAARICGITISEDSSLSGTPVKAVANGIIHHGATFFSSDAELRLANLVSKSSLMAHRRHFARIPSDDDGNFDDVEARLMGDTDTKGGMFMSDSGYDMAGTSLDDYRENEFEGDSSWAKLGVDRQASDGEEEDEDDSDEDSEDSLNEASDEEFEGEQTDEELDDLLANTPLFDPPDLELDEPEKEFSFRPEGPVYYPGMEYEPEELDVTRPLPARKREQRAKEVISVEEAIDLADFRNVQYLTKFITETGTIIARKEFVMRTKSHNRITKAIKTARFFGLMPYTNMGRPRYVFNEPFDELEEFYSTDEEDEMPPQDSRAGYGSRLQERNPTRWRSFNAGGIGRGSN